MILIQGTCIHIPFSKRRVSVQRSYFAVQASSLTLCNDNRKRKATSMSSHAFTLAFTDRKHVNGCNTP